MHCLKLLTNRLVTPLLILAAGLVTLGAQTSPTIDMTRFAGTWKEDLAKTVHDVPVDGIRKYEQSPDGGMSITIGTGENAYHDTFRVDGKTYPVTPSPGEMQTWTHPDPATWESTVTRQDATPYLVRRTVSPDGATLTFETIVKGRDGKDVTEKLLYHRISPEKNGLVGSWKPVSDSTDTPGILSMQAAPDGALSVSGLVSSYKIKPDGKPYPVVGGPFDVSLRLPANRTLEFTFYKNAKPIEIDTFTLSPDGRAFNEIELDPNTNKQISSTVYRKQP